MMNISRSSIHSFPISEEVSAEASSKKLLSIETRLKHVWDYEIKMMDWRHNSRHWAFTIQMGLAGSCAWLWTTNLYLIAFAPGLVGIWLAYKAWMMELSSVSKFADCESEGALLEQEAGSPSLFSRLVLMKGKPATYDEIMPGMYRDVMRAWLAVTPAILLFAIAKWWWFSG